MNYVQSRIWKNVSKIIMYGDCVRDYIYGDFVVDLAVFSSLFDAISNGTTIISLNRLANKIHASGYHPLSIPVSRNGLSVRRLIILTMTNMYFKIPAGSHVEFYSIWYLFSTDDNCMPSNTNQFWFYYLKPIKIYDN